jgi:hypothetical protein
MEGFDYIKQYIIMFLLYIVINTGFFTSLVLSNIPDATLNDIPTIKGHAINGGVFILGYLVAEYLITSKII